MREKIAEKRKTRLIGAILTTLGLYLVKNGRYIDDQAAFIQETRRNRDLAFA